MHAHILKGIECLNSFILIHVGFFCFDFFCLFVGFGFGFGTGLSLNKLPYKSKCKSALNTFPILPYVAFW